jgi:hypothetical protein
MAGIIVEVRAALHAEPRAIVPTQGLEWQAEHYLVAEQRFEVDEVTCQPAGQVIVWFHARVDVQLLDVNVELIGDLIKATYALSADLHRGSAADEHSLDHGFEPKIQLDRRSGWYSDHSDSEVGRSFDGCSNELHRARATTQFVGVEDQT